jgi:Flp pilus assembly protein TadD
MAHNSSGNFSDAVSPLEAYVRKVPTDPAGHYQLALAYARTGRRDDSAREMALQQQLLQKKEASPSVPADGAPR